MRFARAGYAAIAASFLLGTLVAPAPARTAVATWNQFHYAATRSGNAPNEKTLGPNNVSTAIVTWQRRLSGPVYGTPLVSADRVFALEYTGRLDALARSTGSPLWSVKVGTTTNSTPVLWGSLAIVAGADRQGDLVAAYGMSHGNRVWRTRLRETSFVTPPALYGDTLYFSVGTSIYAMAAATGRVLWRTVLPAAPDRAVDGPVAVSAYGQYVVAATNDGHVYLLVGADGRRGWDVLAGGGIHTGGPAIYNGIAYVPEGRGGDEGGGFDVVALQLTDGREVWRGYAGDDVHVTPAAGAGKVVIGSIDEGLVARDSWTGALLWTAPYEGEVWGSPVIANGVVYVGTDAGIVAYDAGTGAKRWSDPYGLGMANMSSPAIVDGRIYTGSGDGSVIVFGLP